MRLKTKQSIREFFFWRTVSILVRAAAPSRCIGFLSSFLQKWPIRFSSRVKFFHFQQLAFALLLNPLQNCPMVRCLDKLTGLVDFGKSQFRENPGSKLKLFAVFTTKIPSLVKKNYFIVFCDRLGKREASNLFNTSQFTLLILLNFGL